MDREHYMSLALELARQAGEGGDVPVGCVIVKDGEVIGRGQNRRERTGSALGHAEIEAIHEANLALGDWRLDGCEMYVTLEPCPMCAGAVMNSRISVLVYGAREAQTGSCASVLNLFEENYPSRPAIYAGVLADESAALLREFFRGKR